jgi:hypothetical protein
MPVCEGCGGSYENQFKFCPHCGRAKPESNTLNINVTSDDVWETCEINLVHGESQLFAYNVKWYFEATAIGTKGRYAAALSEVLKKPVAFSPIALGDYWYSGQEPVLLRERCQPKLDNLISKLVTDGWQPIGRGQEWYSERFRRKVKK